MQRWRERIRTDIIRIKFYREEGEQLENYTKYKLKSNDELASVLDGSPGIIWININTTNEITRSSGIVLACL